VKKAAPPPSIISAADLRFARSGREVLRGVNLHLDEGEIVALLGANGAGKSTLFRLLLGLLKPTKGQVLLDGTPLQNIGRRAIARRLAYVPQSHVTPFPYTVAEIVTLGRLPGTGLIRSPSREDKQIVASVMERLSIGHLGERPYSEISGGERQLALIARALAQGAGAIIMDEPLTGLDYGYQIRLLCHLNSLAREGLSILFSTHNPEHAALTANRIAVLNDGRIAADGEPDVIVTAEMIRAIYGVDVVVELGQQKETRIFPTRH
jgi:iron complex transport system ATP-binding protein